MWSIVHIRVFSVRVWSDDVVKDLASVGIWKKHCSARKVCEYMKNGLVHECAFWGVLFHGVFRMVCGESFLREYFKSFHACER